MRFPCTAPSLDASKVSLSAGHLLRQGLAAAALVALAAGTQCATAQAPTPQAIVALRYDALSAPLGVDDVHPRLSWQMSTTRRGAMQTAYEVLVASSPALLQAGTADVWDSQKTTSSDSVQVAYAGKALESRKQYFWQVRVWDDRGIMTTSDTSQWEMGLLRPTDWNAAWIARNNPVLFADYATDPSWIWVAGEDALKSPAAGAHDFRLHIALPQQPVKVTLFITGKDTVTAWANGNKVLAAETLPPWGPLYRWGTFKTVDLAGKLHSGDNVLAAEIDVAKVEQNEAAGLIALLRVELPGGKVLRFRTDTGWVTKTAATGDWFAPAVDDHAWQKAVIAEPVGRPPLGNPWTPSPATLLRKDFQARREVASARLYATALGTYLPRLNGQAIGDQILAPGWTDYQDKVVYQVYDVTSMLHRGINTLGFQLGDGWYGGGLVFFQQRFNYGPPPVRLRAQLEIRYTDGSIETIASDKSWLATDSPMLLSDLYNGERYDARRELPGWDRPGAELVGWTPVALEPASTAVLMAQDFQPIRVDMVLKPIAITEPSPGVFLFDMGQNMVGRERLTVSGPAGTIVRLRFGEVLQPDGALYWENMRTAEATDTYTLRGGGTETFEPHFTYHGYRYVELTGFPGKPTLDSLAGVVFHTAAPFSMNFETSNPMVQKLIKNILWGQRGNFMSVPTDCPQRDERLGWMADAQVFWRTAEYNMNLDAFSHKFAYDMRSAQVPTGEYKDISPAVGTITGEGSPGWADAGIVIPYTAYTQYDDVELLRESWASMSKYMRNFEQKNPDFVNHKVAYGDWLAIGSKTPQDLIGTAFWAYDAQLMQQMAEAQGLTEEAAHYKSVFESVRAAFQKNFVQPDGTVGSGSQTSYVLALHFNLLPEELRASAAAKLAADVEAHDYHLTTGFLGTPYIMLALTDTGHADTAFRLLATDTYPSWGYMIRNGATTMWERWNGNQMLGDPGMNSFNHYAYGSVAEWLYRDVAGINIDVKQPGFHHFLLTPQFSPSIGHVDASYHSDFGDIGSDWTVSQDGSTAWNVIVPPNTTATVSLPGVHAQDVTEGGRQLALLDAVKLQDGPQGKLTYTLAAGTYQFHVAAAPASSTKLTLAH